MLGVGDLFAEYFAFDGFHSACVLCSGRDGVYTPGLLPKSSMCTRGVKRQPLRMAMSSTRGVVCCNSSDRKSTRLNSSHVRISYAVFCLKKKKKQKKTQYKYN